MTKYLFKTIPEIEEAATFLKHYIEQKLEKEPILVISDEIISTREIALVAGQSGINWTQFYSTIYNAVLRLMQSALDEKTSYKLLLKKHQAYGAKPLLIWEHLGILMRIDSKLARYENLIAQKVTNTDEAPLDTMTDILGYCILGCWLDWRKNDNVG